jgi:hypothetical protein
MNEHGEYMEGHWKSGCHWEGQGKGQEMFSFESFQGGDQGPATKKPQYAPSVVCILINKDDLNIPASSNVLLSC